MRRVLAFTAATALLFPAVWFAPPAGADPLVTVSSLSGTGSSVTVVSTTVPASQLSAATASLSNSTGFPAAVSQRVRALGDTYRSSQWGLEAASFPAAWATTTGAGVTVAVLDTGVDAAHPDLAGQVLPGRDFTGTGPADQDINGHGTHVAGIIAALLDNSLGMAGAASGVRILPIKVLDNVGAGWDANVAAGIIYATDAGAQVINLSLGGDGNPLVEQAVSYAVARNVVVVAAAGNSGSTGNTPVYPAAYAPVVAVGAVDSAGAITYFSNTGDYLDIVAPGASIWSTWRSRAYASFSGTSMAAPFVAAAAALVKSANPSFSAQQVIDRLTATATDIESPGKDSRSGFGMLNAAASVGASAPAPAPTPAPSTPSVPTPSTPSLPGSPSAPSLPGAPSTPPTAPSVPAVPSAPPTAPIPPAPAPGGNYSILSSSDKPYSTPGSINTLVVKVALAGVPSKGVSVRVTDTSGQSWVSLTNAKGYASFPLAPARTTGYSISATGAAGAGLGTYTSWVAPKLKVSHSKGRVSWVLSPSSSQIITVVNVATGEVIFRTVAKSSKVTRGSLRLPATGQFRVEVSPSPGLLGAKSTGFSN